MKAAGDKSFIALYSVCCGRTRRRQRDECSSPTTQLSWPTGAEEGGERTKKNAFVHNLFRASYFVRNGG